jgi:hypothetical protein
VLRRLGRLLGRMQELGNLIVETYPEEIEELREQAEAAAASGQGMATSAPEVAEKFKLRPSQVQRSVDKLRRNKMLDGVIGTTDGYENFRLSPSGATFVAMWQRQHDS